MRYRLLGPLEVEGEDASPLALGTRERVVLATLLLSANRAVRASRLIDALWGRSTPGQRRERAKSRAQMARLLHGAPVTNEGSTAGRRATLHLTSVHHPYPRYVIQPEPPHEYMFMTLP